MPENRGVKDWVGRSFQRSDAITERMIAEFNATFSPHVSSLAGVPPGVFWCLAPDLLNEDCLGGDGHTRPGLFLPEFSLPRRMWAGGEIQSFGEFRAGDMVTKTSTIENIAEKGGKSGTLCFVTVRHHYVVRSQLIINERQDIVYRAATSKSIEQPDVTERTPYVPPDGSWQLKSTPTLLFRYSAMTFNSHRIHYDCPYATEVEGYFGLVVQGPMQATLMLNLVAERLGHFPSSFSYRGLAPLICGGSFSVLAEQSRDGWETKVVAGDGTITMSGQAI